jgi:hypothetical protein
MDMQLVIDRLKEIYFFKGDPNRMERLLLALIEELEKGE